MQRTRNETEIRLERKRNIKDGIERERERESAKIMKQKIQQKRQRVSRPGLMIHLRA